jgi:hypothetical protein
VAHVVFRVTDSVALRHQSAMIGAYGGDDGTNGASGAQPGPAAAG